MNEKEYQGYVILQKEYRAELESEVMQYIKKGWQPIGGVSVIDDKTRSYYQAMVI